MSNHRLHAAAAALLALLLSACAAPAGSGGSMTLPTPDLDPQPQPEPEPEPEPVSVVLQVSEVGGFTTPALLAGRVPASTVYSDGRVITDGPVPAIWPAPALPNLQLHRLDEGGVRELVELALGAGVTETTELGRPPVADATSTRITVRTGGETVTREVYALGIGSLPGTDGTDGPLPGTDSAPFGLTQEQLAARARLAELVDQLRDPSSALGAERVTGPKAYEPEAVAALVSTYVEPATEVVQPEVVWPGPPLPGEPVAPGVACVTATGEQADAVLAAASDASGATPWTTDDGARWSVVLRPLLPHESGCEDLVQG